MIIIPGRMIIRGIFALNVKVEEKIPVSSLYSLLAEMLVGLYLGSGNIANPKLLFYRIVEDRDMLLMTG